MASHASHIIQFFLAIVLARKVKVAIPFWNICKHDEEHLAVFTAAILVRSRFEEVQNAASSQKMPSCHHVAIVSLRIFHSHRRQTEHQIIQISLHAEVPARCQDNFGENTVSLITTLGGVV